MQRRNREVRLLKELRSDEALQKEETGVAGARREPHPVWLKASRPDNFPVSISLETSHAVITFVVIMGAAILLLVVARVFLN
jgi:hypothetical protein